MIGSALRRLRSWLAGASDDQAPEDGVSGTGEPHRDEAYNGRYEAEREVDRIAETAEAIESEGATARHPDQGDG